jgi:murein DD-endopeptidase MepM/ murein hydrolase activator NlpD
MQYGYYISPMQNPYITGWNHGQDENDPRWLKYSNCTRRSPLIPCYHTGIDMASLNGDLNVSSTASGTAYKYYDPEGFGNFVVVDAPNGTCQVYAHLESYEGELANIEVGGSTAIGANTVIGIMGDTGSAEGEPHLHWEERTVEGCVRNMKTGKFDLYYPKSNDELVQNFIDPHNP